MLKTTEAYDAACATIASATGATGTDGPLKGAKCMLFTNDPSLTKTTVKADLTPPAFTGYVEKAITWTGPRRDGSGNIGLETNLLVFTPDDGETPENVTGYAILDTTAATVYGVEKFPDPVPLVDALSSLQFAVDWNFSADNPGGATVV